jgi:hypothetical protein
MREGFNQEKADSESKGKHLKGKISAVLADFKTRRDQHKGNPRHFFNLMADIGETVIHLTPSLSKVK